MQERRAELVREKICDPDIAFREIAMDFGFSSPAHLPQSRPEGLLERRAVCQLGGGVHAVSYTHLSPLEG